MAQPTIVRGTSVDILIGDGATPEVFSIVCGLTTRNFTEQVNTSDSFVADCADPEDVPIRRLIPTGRQWSLSGEGRYNRAQASVLRAAIGVTKNYRFVISEPSGDAVDAGYYEGPAMLTNRQIGGSAGESGNFASDSLQIESDGEWTWNDAA
jgi:hypothetical protein